MKKKILCLCTAAVLCGVAVLFSACSDEDALTKTTYTISNLSDEYNVEDAELATYYKKGSEVPYVGVEDFLSVLDGVLDTSGLKSTVSEDDNTYILCYSNNGLNTFIADWENDTITVSGISFFRGMLEETVETDYTAHMQLLTEWSISSQAITFDLGAYGFDILYYNGQLLLPFYIANLLFFSINLYNVYFNGEAYYGLTQSDTYINMTADDWAQVRTCDWNGTEASEEMRQTTVNFLEFSLNYFYGLKDYKGIDSFGEDVITGDLRSALLSVDAETHNQAYIELFYKQLNELHTSLSTQSFYAEEVAFDLSEEDYGTAFIEYLNIANELAEIFYSSVDDMSYVRFEDDTAIIRLTSFAVGTNSQIYNDDGTVSDTAYMYDTYYAMLYAMQVIEYYSEAVTEINNIVFDLTLNEGGSTDAMLKTLGFLTNEPVPYTYSSLLSSETTIEYYLVDSDDDGDYTDDDAYDMYDWYVLISPYTFSAANTFAAIAQDMGIATIMGEQSGGGTCTVFTFVLPDGTTVNMSSSTEVLGTLEYEQDVAVGMNLIEDGVTPDIYLNRAYFYNDNALIAAIKSAK